MSDDNVPAESVVAVGQTGDTVSIEKLGDQLASEIPQVSQHAVDAEQAKIHEKAQEYADRRDRYGEPFDPNKHHTNSDGSPRLTSTGKLRRKTGIGAGATSKSIIGTAVSASGMSPHEEASARAGGEVAAAMTIQACMLAFGDEWSPVVDESTGRNEQVHMSKAFGDYFVAKDIKDIPPGWALAIALTGYALPRFTQPKTKTRFQLMRSWVADKWSTWRADKDEPQPDPRNDDEREDDPRKEVESTISTEGA